MPASPDPDLALRLARAVAQLYGDAVDQLLTTVARRLARGIDQPGWAERKLLEQVQLRVEAQRIVAELATAGPGLIDEAVTSGWSTGARAGAVDLGVSAVSPPQVEVLVRETVDQLAGTHGRILRSTLDVYRETVARSAGQVVTGTSTRRQAAQQVLDRFADRGITGFTDRAGRRWSAETYAEMATRTSVGRAQVAGTLDQYENAGRDLVIVSDAPQECKVCRPWEGRVLSVSGDDDRYPSVAEARRGGLFHANCRHRLGLYVPGFTRRLTDTADPDGDRARQEQRRLERGVRMWKSRAAVALDDDTRKAAERRGREWQARLRQHIDAEGLKRQPQRERLGAR